MKTLKSAFIILCLIMISANINAQDKKKSTDPEVKFWISMDCENCKAKVEKNIAFEKGVKALEVDLKTKTADITYNGKKTNPDKLKKAIEKLGFTVEEVKTESKSEKKSEKQ